MTHNACGKQDARRTPNIHEQVNPVSAVEVDTKAAIVQNAMHMKRRGEANGRYCHWRPGPTVV
jgi:hypothetical protein